MNERVINNIQLEMEPYLDQKQFVILNKVLFKCLKNVKIVQKDFDNLEFNEDENKKILESFISSKRVEGCSEKTLRYYEKTINHMFSRIDKRLDCISTEDLREYLGNYRSERNISKVTIDNVRRILSSFFGWLEDEDYILKNPVKILTDDNNSPEALECKKQVAAEAEKFLNEHRQELMDMYQKNNSDKTSDGFDLRFSNRYSSEVCIRAMKTSRKPYS